MSETLKPSGPAPSGDGGTPASSPGAATSRASSLPLSRLMVMFFSDIVGSTDLKSRLGTVQYSADLAQHDAIFRQIVDSTGNARILKDTGDGFFASFATASDAVRAALRFQYELANVGSPLKTRVGVHVGEVAELEKEATGLPKVVGLAADFAARVMGLATGGQILLTRFAFNEARQFVLTHPSAGASGEPSLVWVAHGEYIFKGSEEPVDVFEVGAQGLAPLEPPLDGPDARRSVRPGDELTLGWRPAAGQHLRGRANWIIKEKLGEGGFGEVWLAEHERTRAQRVFKFCFEPERLRGLKREVVLFRLLKDALGVRRDIARVVDFQFDEAPYFIETDHYPLGDLATWVAKHGGLGVMPIEQRVSIAAGVAEAVAAAHSVGVLHKDIKPSNILLGEDEDGTLFPVLTDFGIGILTDRKQLENRDFTVVGFTQTAMTMNESSRTGTRIYAPPESLLNQPFTVQGDVYALGVLLYQLVTGDLNRPLAEGWERDVADPLLREDIAACVEGDPGRRLSSASELARRLRSLGERRAAIDTALRAEAAARKRRTMVRALTGALIVLVALSVGLVFALRERVCRLDVESKQTAIERDARTLAESGRAAADAERVKAEAERDKAKREEAKAVAVTEFLRNMLASVDPAQANKQDITVRETLDRAAEKIGDSMKSQPEIEAAIRGAIGRTYLVLGLFPQAEPQLRLAVELGTKSAPDAPLTIKAMNDLSVLYLYTGNFPKAESAFLDLLKVRERVYGEKHAEFADSLFNLSLVYYQTRQYEKGMAYGNRALELRQSLFGEESLPVAASLQYLGLTENDAGHLLQAEQLSEKSLAIREKLYPPNHFELGNSNANLGLILMNEGKLEAARERFNTALKIFEKALDPEHPSVATVLLNLAAIEIGEKHYDAAKTLAERAVAIQEKRLGPDHPDLARSINALAKACEEKGDYAVAETLYNRAASIYEKANGTDHPTTLAFRFNVALTYARRGNPKECINRLGPIIEKFRENKLDKEVVQCKIALVDAMIQDQQFAQAEPIAVELHDETQKLETDELRTSQGLASLELIAALYERWDKPEQAKPYREQIKLIRAAHPELNETVNSSATTRPA